MNKKILVFTLVLTMALSMSACGSSKKSSEEGSSESTSAMSSGKMKAGTTESDVKVENTASGKETSKNSKAGYYKIIKFISEGEDITQELHEMEALGSGIYLVMNEDGTGHVSMFGENTEFDWNEKTFIMHEESGEDTETPYSFEDGQITMKADNTEMVFAPLTDEELKAFESGESNKTMDEITDDLLNEALGDATKELDDIAGKAEEDINKAAEDGAKAIEEASGESEEQIEGALNEAKDSLSGSLSGGLSGSASGKKSGSTSSDSDSSSKVGPGYLPDLSSGKHTNAGYYDIMAFQENGNTYTKAQLQKAGVEFDMMLCPDGTGYAHFIGTYYDLSWDDGTIYVATDEGQEKMIYFASDFDGKSVITISDSAMAMVFEYVKDADPTYEWTGESGLMPD